jgi:hypothetical protein
MEGSEDTIEGSVRLIEKEVGLREGFLEELRREDDWSFIIKVHALLEAAISHLLCRALGRDEFAGVFAFMDLSDKRAGKMAFVRALGVLEKPDRRFISSLSELRNQLVHNVRNAGFDLQGYVNGLTPEKLRAFAQNFDSFSVGNRVDFDGQQLAPEEVFKREAKRAIWWSAMVTVALVYQFREIERLRSEAQRLDFVNNALTRILTPREEP